MGQAAEAIKQTVTGKDPNIQIFIQTQKDFYIAGKVVQGIVSIDVKADSPYQALVLTIVGKQKVFWSEGGNQNTRWYSNEITNYRSSFKLMDFDKVIKKGQYGVPFEFMLPRNLPDNKIGYKLEAALVHSQQNSKNQRQQFQLNVLEAKSQKPELREQQFKQIQFCGYCGCSGCCKYGGIKVSLKSNKSDVTRGDQIHILGTIQNRSDQRVTSVKAQLLNNMKRFAGRFRQDTFKHWDLQVNSKSIDSGSEYSFEIFVRIPQQIKSPSAIGRIIANSYSIEVKARTSGCSGNGYGHLHIPVYDTKPTFKTTKKKAFPNSWNVIQAPLASMMKMQPFIWANTFRIAYKNSDENKMGIPPKFEENIPGSANNLNRDDL